MRIGAIVNTIILFCPGCESMGIIVASPSCTEYHWGTLPTLFVKKTSAGLHRQPCMFQ